MDSLTKFLKYIRSKDMFGYTFKWKFDGRDVHKTLFGATVSIVVNSLILWHLYVKMHEMATYGNDSITEN